MTEKRHYAYIARCADGTFYTGYTTDPKRREQAHNAGKGAKYTRTRRPVAIIYTESFETKEEAMRREWEIKQLSRTQKETLLGAKGAFDGSKGASDGSKGASDDTNGHNSSLS